MITRSPPLHSHPAWPVLSPRDLAPCFVTGLLYKYSEYSLRQCSKCSKCRPGPGRRTIHTVEFS